METISVKELNELGVQNVFVLDVRSEQEYLLSNIDSVLIPLDQLETRYTELDSTKTIYCLCHHGMRSGYAGRFLESKGFSTVNILGGIDAWSLSINSSTPRY